MLFGVLDVREESFVAAFGRAIHLRPAGDRVADRLVEKLPAVVALLTDVGRQLCY
jgi:hypothetical protein